LASLHASASDSRSWNPIMKPLTLMYSTVVIVDGYNVSADILADRFRSLSAKVHVVSNAGAAAVLVRNKKVDVVFIGYRPSPDITSSRPASPISLR
jgi:hypothetical protein